MKPQIVINEYKLFNVIGKGSFGEVFLTIKGNDPKKRATKRLDFTNVSDEIRKYLSNEIKIMKELDHPNVIHLEKIVPSSHHYYVVMEYCNGGDLSLCLKKNGKPFNQEIIQHFMRQIVEGLKYIHSKKIIHRDLKLENILLNFKNEKDMQNFNLLASEVKIIDFSLARKLDCQGLASTALGSPLYMDPIILKKYDKAGGFDKLQKYNEKADIWSLGTVCYQLLTGETLFKAINIKELIAKMEKGNYILPIKDGLTYEIISFINSMLKYDANARSSAEELSKHRFLTGNVKDFTKPDYNSLSHIIRDNSLIINTKENINIWDSLNERIKNKSIKNEIFDINNLLEEYNAAKEYFKENNLIEREQNANKICEKIKQVKSQYEIGNNAILKCLPKPITPEFIYGCTIEERNYKYHQILTKKLNEKKILESKIKAFIVNTFNLNNEQKLLYDKYKAELNKLNIDLKELEINYKNIWAPAPEYIKELNESKSEKIYNFNLIQIDIKKTDIIKENINLIVTLKRDQLIMNTKEVSLNFGNNFNDKWEWQIFISDWIHIDKYYLKIENNNKLLSKRKPFKIRVVIGKIKNGKGITFNSVIPETNNEIIQTTIYPIILEGKKYIPKESNDTMNIKIFKPFKYKNCSTGKIPNQ